MIDVAAVRRREKGKTMGKVPKPRGGGQTGGDGHRGNRRAFRAAGGQVGRSKGCAVLALAFLSVPAAVVAAIYYHIA